MGAMAGEPLPAEARAALAPLLRAAAAPQCPAGAPAEAVLARARGRRAVIASIRARDAIAAG
jgi:hypothetical protein